MAAIQPIYVMIVEPTDGETMYNACRYERVISDTEEPGPLYNVTNCTRGQQQTLLRGELGKFTECTFISNSRIVAAAVRMAEPKIVEANPKTNRPWYQQLNPRKKW